MTTSAPPSLMEKAERAVDWVRSRAPGIEAEVYCGRGEDRGLELREGKLRIVQEAAEEGMGLRLFRDGRMAFASAGGPVEDLENLFSGAYRQLAHLPHDEHRGPPAPPASGGPEDSLAESLYDPALFTRPLQDWAPVLFDMQERAIRMDTRVRKVLQAGYGEGRSEVAIASTAGVRAYERGTSCGFGLSVMGEEGSEVQVGSGSTSARSGGGLDCVRETENAVWRSVSLLGARKLPSRRRAVLIDPWVAGEFLDLVVGALSADVVQRGRSLFKGRLGERVASPRVTFVDDPRRPGGVASALFDDEGLPTRRKTLMDAGVLREYFYDDYTARKAGRASNASASRSGYRGLPGPGPSNFYMEPGYMSRESLIADTSEGILALELLGMHTADPVSGEFSIGVAGVEVENGRLGRGVKGAMVSGNLLGVLAGIDAAADDLHFYGSIAAPTFRIAGLMVA